MKTKDQKSHLCFVNKKKLAKLFLVSVSLCFNSPLVAQNTSSYDANTLSRSGSACAAFGVDALLSNTGSDNTAVGSDALKNQGSGNSNTAVGSLALQASGNFLYNTAVGNQALQSNTTNGDNNTGIGFQALIANTTGNNNTGVGVAAMGANTAGTENTAVGSNAGATNTGGNDITLLGFNADVSAGSLSNASAIGANAIVNASNRVWLGDASVLSVWATSATYLSDGRFKTKITDDDVKGLEFITLLRPVTYNFEAKKLAEFMTKNMSEIARNRHLNRDFGPASAIRQSGFIAQEVEAAAKKVGYDFNGVHSAQNSDDTYGLSYQLFVVPLVKAVQEQQQMIDQQKQRIDALEKVNNVLINKNATPTGINISSSTDGFNMEQNIPNPFTNETVIKYNLPQSINKAYMAIYDLTGKQLSTLPLTEKGASQITITSEKFAAGIYIYSIVGDGKILDSKRMVIADK